MDLINDKVKNIFFKYLFLSFGSALITSIYSIVDMMMVGKYHGYNGTAALAIVAPVWNIIYSLGLLTGIGGSVLYANKKAKNDLSCNQYFTSSVIFSIVLAIIVWICFIFFDKPILFFFGADESLYQLAKLYIEPIKFVIPLYLFNQMLASYLRNDNDPKLATIGVLSGGIFNIVGDYLFVFVFDMGIFGAGLATALGACISFFVLLSHFFFKRNSLKLVKVDKLFSKIKEITIVGFSTFFIDVAMGILTILFNKQIMKYLGTDALSVYGIIINISTFVQCLAYAVGQASQPLISSNYSQKKYSRIKETLKYSLIVSFIIGIIWTGFSLIFPNSYVYIFMSENSEILNIAPNIIRMYCLSFLLLPFNIYLTYYFQAIMKANISFVISFVRGFCLSGILILVLPLINKDLIWFSMPITELVIFIFGVIVTIKYTLNLEKIN